MSVYRFLCPGRILAWFICVAFVLGFGFEGLAATPLQADSVSNDRLAKSSKRKKRKKRSKRKKRRRPPKPPPEKEAAKEEEAKKDAEPVKEKAPPPEPEPVAPPTPPPPPEPIPPPPEPVTEEEVDFGAEETASDQESAKIKAAAGGGHGKGPGLGVKIFADLLLEHAVGAKKFEFKPHHQHVIVQVSMSDDLMFAIHVSDNPIYYELVYALTPQLRIRAGKMFIPFGTNQFHHIIGGRVDELSSFLPETWTDFGVGIHHSFYDGEYMSAEYDFYVVNGFQGVERPIFGTGVASDNNMNKGIGARLRLDFLGHYAFVGSLYYDVWDSADSRALVFYSLGLELNKGFIDVPVLDRIGLRGEWSRGEVQLQDSNNQQGIMEHAFARAGFYGELTVQILEKLSFRFRTGRVNPDNTVEDDTDLWVFEPAFIIGSGKLTLRIAYQMTMLASGGYSAKNPPDIAYAKFWLQY
jgi:hypothetical protein